MPAKKTGFDFDALTWVHFLMEVYPQELLSSKARLALLILARHCNPTHQCFIGMDRLATMMGVTLNTARSAIKELECPPHIGPSAEDSPPLGVTNEEAHFGGGTRFVVRTDRLGTSPVYFLNVWNNDLPVPKLLANGRMDNTAPTAPTWALEAAAEAGENFPFYCFLKSQDGERYKALKKAMNDICVRSLNTAGPELEPGTFAMQRVYPLLNEAVM